MNFNAFDTRCPTLIFLSKFKERICFILYIVPLSLVVSKILSTYKTRKQIWLPLIFRYIHYPWWNEKKYSMRFSMKWNEKITPWNLPLMRDLFSLKEKPSYWFICTSFSRVLLKMPCHIHLLQLKVKISNQIQKYYKESLSLI